MIDTLQAVPKRAWRLAGRVTYYAAALGLFVYFRIGSRTRVLVVCGDELLLVRPWMGTGRWILPGGGLHRHEDPELGARREVLEETGIILPPKLDNLGDFIAQGWERYSYTLFMANLESRPDVQLRQLEILDAQWFTRDELLKGTVPLDAAASRHVADYVRSLHV